MLIGVDDEGDAFADGGDGLEELLVVVLGEQRQYRVRDTAYGFGGVFEEFCRFFEAEFFELCLHVAQSLADGGKKFEDAIDDLAVGVSV